MSWAGYQKPSSNKHSSKARPHHDGKSSRSHRPEKHESASRPSPSLPLEFLFVVNEVNLNVNAARNADIWGNFTPPVDISGFDHESIGQVFRYRDGHVSSVAGEYVWCRDPNQRNRGSIQKHVLMYDGTGQQVYGREPQQPYQTRTVFNCGPFVPHVYGDGDASVGGPEEYEEGNFVGWRALHLDHEAGVSRIGFSHKCVAGGSPSWLDSHQIISELYKRPRNLGVGPHSQGLGGEVAIIIGLMALSQKPGKVDEAFMSRQWDNNQWSGRLHSEAWPSAHDDPRGVTVHVALDPNPVKCQTMMQAMEYVDRYQVWLQG